MTLRILCYGDSLTAGSPGSDGLLTPYGPHLELALRRLLDIQVTVRHVGLSGWKASELREGADSAPTGLRHLLEQWANGSASGPIDAAILLAGTNDLGSASSERDVAPHVIALHRIAHSVGVRTIAVGVPQSGYTDASAAMEATRLASNRRIEAWCKASTRCTYVECPIAWDGGGALWEPGDGLHLSSRGYAALGKRLAEPVARALGRGDQFVWDGPRFSDHL